MQSGFNRFLAVHLQFAIMLKFSVTRSILESFGETWISIIEIVKTVVEQKKLEKYFQEKQTC